MDLPYDPDIPLLGTFPKDSISYYKDVCLYMVIVVLLTIVRK